MNYIESYTYLNYTNTLNIRNTCGIVGTETCDCIHMCYYIQSKTRFNEVLFSPLACSCCHSNHVRVHSPSQDNEVLEIQAYRV